MPLQPNKEVFITCAVTGSGNTQDRNLNVPRSPKEIADMPLGTARDHPAVPFQIPLVPTTRDMETILV